MQRSCVERRTIFNLKREANAEAEGSSIFWCECVCLKLNVWLCVDSVRDEMCMVVWVGWWIVFD